MPDNQKNQIIHELQGRNITYKQIILLNDSYKLADIEVIDPYHNVKKYKHSIAPIAKYAITPEHVKNDLKVHIEYLYKAAEIVRREPYCNEVEMVEFSHSKSTPNNPIIFVQYKRKENRWVNHYLSLPEIDEQYRILEGTDITTV